VKKIILASCLSLALGACGGGGYSSSSTDPETYSDPDTTTETGIFIDAPVKGLAYTASPSGKTGTTNEEGEFKYVEEDTVEFSMGSISLGTAMPDENRKVKVTDFYNGGPIAQLLQTLNHHSDESSIHVNGVVFPDGLKEKLIARLEANDDADILTSEELDNIKAKNPLRAFRVAVKSKEDTIGHIKEQIGKQGLTFIADELADTVLFSRSLLTPHKGQYRGLIIQFLQEGEDARWIEVKKSETVDAKTSWQIDEGNLVFNFQDSDDSYTFSKSAKGLHSMDISYSRPGKGKGMKGLGEPKPFVMSDLNNKSFTLTGLDGETQNITFSNGTYNCETDSLNSCIYKDAAYKNVVWLASSEDENTLEGRFLLLARGSLAKGKLLAIQYDASGNFNSVKVLKVSGVTAY